MPSTEDPAGKEGLEPMPDEQGLGGLSLPPGLQPSSGLVRSVSRLRLLLVTVERRYDESHRRVVAFRQQLRRVPTRAVNGHLAVDAYLAVMAETRARLQRAEQEMEDLDLLKRRVTMDLRSLELMGKIQQTQQELAELREQARWDARDEVAAEIRRLERVAGEFVAEAARSITTGDEPPPTLEPPPAGR